MNTYYLYRHIRLDKNEPFYIGISRNLDGKYKRAYVKGKYKRSEFWINIIKKSEYKVEIVLDNLTKEEALLKEMEFITLYGRRDLGTGFLVNLSDGGEIPLNRSLKGLKNIAKSSSSRCGEKSPKYKGKIWALDKRHYNKIKLFTNLSEIKKFLGRQNKRIDGIYHNLSGKTTSAYGYIWARENYEEKGLPKIFFRKPKLKIIDTKTGKVFKCIEDLCDEYNINKREKHFLLRKLRNFQNNNTTFKYL